MNETKSIIATPEFRKHLSDANKKWERFKIYKLLINKHSEDMQLINNNFSETAKLICEKLYAAHLLCKEESYKNIAQLAYEACVTRDESLAQITTKFVEEIKSI